MIKKNKYLYLISLIIPVIILLIVFIIKDLYPFGSETISNADMGQAYLPAYYNLWDLFHGNTDLFFNFNIGAGSNIYDLGSIYGFFDPTNWLIALTSRNNIPNFINYLLIIKISLISLSSCYVFKRLFNKVSNYFIITFSILYAFSSYVIAYHTNIPWLSITMLFPLLILGLKNIFDNKSSLLYIITLFLTLIFSIYLSYMILLFILFSTGLYLYIFIDKKKRKKYIFKIGISTLISLGLSAFATVPVLYQILSSHRYSFSSTAVYNSMEGVEFINKIILLCFYGLPIFLLFKFFSKYKKNKKEVLFIGSILLLTTISIFIEPINLMWHTGSYIMFPYRFAFIPIFFIYLASLYYVDKYDFKFIMYDTNKRNIIAIIISSIFFIIMVVIYKVFYIDEASYLNPGNALFIGTGLFLLIAFIYSLLINILVSKLDISRISKYVLVSILLLVQIISHASLYIGVSRNNLDREFNDESAFLANEIYDYGINDNTLYKYKDLDYTMFENYPFISKKSSLSTWHMMSENQRLTHVSLGYAYKSVKLRDHGGTIFSDQILGINRLITNKELSDDYKLVGSTNHYKIYEYKNSMSYGIVYNKENKLSNIDYSKNKLEINNLIYQKLFDKDDNLFNSPKYTKEEYDTYDKYIFNFDNKSYLYFEINVYSNTIEKIKVNNKLISIPDINNSNNTNYYFGTGLLDLGVHEGRVEVLIYKDKNTKYIPSFISISYDKIWNLIDNNSNNNLDISIDNNKISIKGDSDKNKSLFIPVTYDKGLYAYNNGKRIDVNKSIGNFISVDLLEKDNNIEIRYYPPYLNISIIISVLSILLLIIYIKYLDKINNNIIFKITYVLYIITYIILFFYIYVFWIFRNIK